MNPSAPTILHLAALAGLWGLYGLLHSVLAARRVKQWAGQRWPGLLPGYRLLFNGLAVALFIPPYLLMRAWGGEPLWVWSGAWAWLMNGTALAAAVAFVISLRDYDLAVFAGTAQWRARASARVDADQGLDSAPAVADAPEGLRLGRLHRLVRHPWYFLALLLIWTQPMDAAFLVSALCWTAYLAIGLRFEERKLLRDYGEVYARYQQQVPALLPQPWRRISAAEAQALQAESRGH